MPPIVLVVLGAIPGAWLRYALLRFGSARLRLRHWATWGLNMLACCLLGVVAGVGQQLDVPKRNSLELALAVGFLGSLSTYSTLMAELVCLWQASRKQQALLLATASLLGGLMACLLGFQLARGGW